MDITNDSELKRSTEVIASEVENEFVMMCLQSGKYFGIDSIGGDIWKLIEEPIRVSEICERLVKEYNVDLATCEKDVLSFLKEMKAQDLISIL